MGAVDHQHIDVPAAYRGTWALQASLCGQKDFGPAFVRIGPRHVFFYEDFGYLSLGQLNEAEEPAEFFGRFTFVHNLTFSDEVIRLDMKGGKLLVTRNAVDSDAEPNAAPWTRCSADEG